MIQLNQPVRHTGRDCRYPEHREVNVGAGSEPAPTSMATGCILGIRVPNPTGGEAVQIGYPADLSGNPCRNDGVFFSIRIAL